MTVQQVLYVLEVAKVRSVSRAAERLYLSQSALSQQLRKLEEELGYPLFSRTAHGLELTDGGALFCREGAQVAEVWRSFCGKVEQDHSREHIRLRLGIGSRVYSNGLFPHVMAFFEANPRLEVTLYTEAGHDVLEALRRGELDLALDRLPMGEESVLMNRSDPRAGQPSITVPELQGCTMMSGLEDSAEDRNMREVCRRFHIKIGRIYRSDGIDTNMRLVREGTGVALGPASFADYYQVAAVPLDPELWVSLQFVCLKSTLKRPEVRQFRDYLQAICKQRESLAGTV